MNKNLTIKDEYCFFLKGELSQWWPSPFVHNRIQFKNCEQWMMWAKAILFHDEETARKILMTSSPKEAKSLGRMVKNFDQNTWDINKYDIVFQGNLYKYDSNKGLKEFLISTKPYKLVEANGHDKVWGIGKFVDDPKLMSIQEWGENLLGKILTEVRDNY